MKGNQGLSILLAAVVSAVVSGTAFGDVRREQPERRPYIVEIGPPHAIDDQALQLEQARISDLQSYIADYGYPDYAEIQEIEPEWPWKPYEVRVYYLDRNLEADFGGVFLSPAAPNFGVMKFHATMTPEKRHEIELVLQSRVQPAVSGAERMEALLSRVEAAAERAVRAANRATADSEAAARAADRAVRTVKKMERRSGKAR